MVRCTAPLHLMGEAESAGQPLSPSVDEALALLAVSALMPQRAKWRCQAQPHVAAEAVVRCTAPLQLARPAKSS